MQSIDEIIEWLKKNLNEKRFAHTMGVAQTAQSLAEKWGANTQDAFLAGLVHDCAKEVPLDKTIELLEQDGVKLGEMEKRSPGILHAPLGAILARDIFGIANEDVLSAVRYHTTGRENMTLLEKIVYVADFIEPNRPYKEAEIIRLIAEEDIDKAVLCETDMVIKFNIDKGRFIHTDTIKTRNYFLIMINEGRTNEA